MSVRPAIPMKSAAMAASLAIGLLAMPAWAQDAAATVDMTDSLRFTPETVTVQVGDSVLWRNTSNVPHTVTADPAKANDPSHVQLPQGAETFDSGMMQPGDEFRHTFTVPGTYQYFCIPHEAAGMLGTVVVEGG